MSSSSFLRQLSATTERALREAAISRPLDILLHFPLRYEDWQTPQAPAQWRNGETVLTEGEIVDTQIIFTRGERRQLLVHLQDDAHTITLRFFHLTAGLERSMNLGRRLRARGVVRRGYQGWELSHPKIQTAEGGGALTPIYPALGKLPQERLRRLVQEALAAENWAETTSLRWRHFDGGEWTLKDAFAFIHLPPAKDAPAVQAGQHPAWQRLRFDELLAHQIILRAQYRRNSRRRTTPYTPPPDWDTALQTALPFALTADQKKAIAEVCTDLRRPVPMRRLLQGDVGSGKTAVAAFACMCAIKSGRTAALLAPTEILAQQHYTTLSALFSSSRVHCELLTGAIRGTRRRELLSRLKFNLSQMVVGTHALFQEDVSLERLGLVVIDEQHRFGVAQRAAIAAAQTEPPHQLMMSATPIPRTLAMSAFADMDLSILAEKPPGRGAISTRLVSTAKRHEVLARVAASAQEGGGAYWVCPLIAESEKADLQDVSTLLEQAQQAHPSLCAEVLHGRMKGDEKLAVIERFRRGETRLLVATTVIEVGVDVPQADVMVIDQAERMGLSQLHQLRGRVGRGGQDGVCVLLYGEDIAETALTRLKTLRGIEDGFEIARRDLSLRGPGEWLGTRQSGLPVFRVARLAEDASLISAAGQAAEWMLSNDRRACARHVRRWFGGRKRGVDSD